MNETENKDVVEIKCLEKVMQYITKLIQLHECEDIKDLIKLTDCALSVSAQLGYLRNCTTCEEEE